MKQPKDKYEHVTKSTRIQWVVSPVGDEEPEFSKKAVFYVLEPMYHSHPWVACTAFVGDMVSLRTYEQTELEPAQIKALNKAKHMAFLWTEQKRISRARRVRSDG